VEDKSFYYVLLVLVGLQCAYIYVLEHSMKVLSDETTIANCLEALSYEEIWHNTLQSHISDAIVFVSPSNFPISFNTKMNDMLEPKQ
jgi:hypothetical protein